MLETPLATSRSLTAPFARCSREPDGTTQYVYGDFGEKVYGVWVIPHEMPEPFVIDMGDHRGS
jgi:hypothetical protein